ncbi:MAG TPA: hypothetical protein PLL71_03210 [Agriterribacter sp.]|nr:hypothetical protein [Agriterribacter sp.]HRQ49439.1 hypothetical protein [Agriterribacter sp.]
MKVKFAGAIPEILSSLLILVWVYAAFSKIIDFKKFELALDSSPLIGPYAGGVAAVLPFIELSVATLLFLPACRLWGFSASFILMLGFTAYLGYMILFVPHLPCTCGGILEKLGWTEHLVFNIGLLIIAALGLFRYKRSKLLLQ